MYIRQQINKNTLYEFNLSDNKKLDVMLIDSQDYELFTLENIPSNFLRKCKYIPSHIMENFYNFVIDNQITDFNQLL